MKHVKLFENFAKEDVVKKAAAEFAKKNSSLNSESSRNKCIEASFEFINYLMSKGIISKDIHPSRFMSEGVIHGEEHYWVNVDGVNYDFTASQYDNKQPYPLTWKDSDSEMHPLEDSSTTTREH